MGSLLMRRRGVMGSPGGALPEWDVDWSYTDGLPEENGFTKFGAGTQSAALRDADVRLYAKGPSSNVGYIYGQGNPVSVFETEFMITSNNGIVRFLLFNGSGSAIAVRAQYSNNYKGVYLMTDTTIGNMAKLQTIAVSTRYRIRLVLDGTYGYVYIGDVLAADKVDLSTINTGSVSDTSFRFGDASKGAVYCNLYALRMKLGRT